jgi:hypothetical protein
MKTTETYPRLMDSLNDVRRHWRGTQVAEGVLLAVGGTLAALLAVVAADNLLKLDKPGRFILAVLLWGTFLAALATFVIRRVLDDRRDDYFAALVEREHPELRNRLINALQLGRGNQNGHSPRLIAAIVEDAAAATADLDLARSLDRRPGRRAAVFAGCAALLCALYAVALWPYFARGLARVLFPVADIDPYTATRITVRHDRDRVPEGSPVVLAADISGVIPEDVRLFLKNENGRWQPGIPMKPATKQTTDEARVFRFKAAQVTRSFTYYVAAGDAQSPEYQARVVKRPAVERLTLTYVRPAYTQTRPYRVDMPKDEGEISGIAATTVTVRVTASKALRRAELIARPDGEPPTVIPMRKASAEDSWEGSLVLWTREATGGDDIPGERVNAPGQYQIRLADTDGYENLDPPVYPITLAQDQPPSVVITRPGRDLTLRPGEAVGVTVEAQDDFGIDAVRVLYRVNNEKTPRELKKFVHPGKAKLQTVDSLRWTNLSSLGLKHGDKVEYWAVAADRNHITGPGVGLSRPFTLTVRDPQQLVRELDEAVFDYAEAVENLLKLQRQNRAETDSGYPFGPLIDRQVRIRRQTHELAERMRKSGLPLGTMVKALQALYRGLMVKAVGTLEQGRDAADPDAEKKHRRAALVVQDRIIAELEALLLRLQNNERAKKALRRIQKKDKAAHKKITAQLAKMIDKLDELVKDETKLVSKFQRMPKKTTDETKEDKLRLTKEMEAMRRKWKEWAKGTIDELAKLPTGFVDDFKLRKDVNSVYEEIEKAAQRPKAEKIEVSLEDLGAGLATKMKEDLETWMPDTPDAAKWVLEEPLNKKTPKVPEMPLPKKLEDLIGDLLQKEEKFDEEADDVTSAWGDNLDQAGWGVSDGPISTFSAKGKTGNDLPNSNELSGRSGDGRRGKSTGQMVGDTARGLKGRKTPARVGNERYEPGQLKQENLDDPQGATGGGKKAGAGRKGLQGGTPPDVVKNLGRLSAKQAGLREKAEQVAKKLATRGIKSSRLDRSIRLFRESEKDLRNYRYQDAARKRKLALRSLKAAALEIDQSSGLHLSRSRDLPPELRKELLQGADDGYPPGYEALLKNYYKELSKAEK